LGAGAFVLQNWGISLVPLTSLVFINALQGTQYLFLLILTTIFSSEKIILQKIIAVLLICAGLAFLAIK
jgi:drug/metabolite transporter (DMT)-like permease